MEMSSWGLRALFAGRYCYQEMDVVAKQPKGVFVRFHDIKGLAVIENGSSQGGGLIMLIFEAYPFKGIVCFSFLL